MRQQQPQDHPLAAAGKILLEAIQDIQAPGQGIVLVQAAAQIGAAGQPGDIRAQMTADRADPGPFVPIRRGQGEMPTAKGQPFLSGGPDNRSSGQGVVRLAENPGITDRGAGNHSGGTARLGQGAQHILGLHDPPVHRHRHAHQLAGQSGPGPISLPFVALHGGPTMKGDPRRAGVLQPADQFRHRGLTVTPADPRFDRDREIHGAGHGPGPSPAWRADRAATLPRPPAGRSSAPSSHNLCQ